MEIVMKNAQGSSRDSIAAALEENEQRRQALGREAEKLAQQRIEALTPAVDSVKKTLAGVISLWGENFGEFQTIHSEYDPNSSDVTLNSQGDFVIKLPTIGEKRSISNLANHGIAAERANEWSGEIIVNAGQKNFFANVDKAQQHLTVVSEQYKIDEKLRFLTNNFFRLDGDIKFFG
jgi:hypothetical protein